MIKNFFAVILLVFSLLMTNQVFAEVNYQKTDGGIGIIFSEKINLFISDNLDQIEKFRTETFIKLFDLRLKTQKEISFMDSQVKTVTESLNEKKDIQDAVKQPITHIKLILLSILVFIFATKIIFYGVLCLIAFFLIRGIYRKIKNR